MPWDGSPDMSGYDLAVVLGGDGTILRNRGVPWARAACPSWHQLRQPGLLGEPFRRGRRARSWRRRLADEAQRGRAREPARGTWCAKETEDEDSLVDAGERSYFALNEAAFTRGARGRIISCGFSVSGEHVASMRGDGLVGGHGHRLHRLRALGRRPACSAQLRRPGGGAHRAAHAAFGARSSRRRATWWKWTSPKTTPTAMWPCSWTASPWSLAPAPVRAIVRKNSSPPSSCATSTRAFYAHASEVFFEGGGVR